MVKLKVFREMLKWSFPTLSLTKCFQKGGFLHELENIGDGHGVLEIPE